MNSKHSTSIRALGQRSFSLTFIRQSSNQSNDSKENAEVGIPSKGPRIPLSDFLNRKLNKASVSPKPVEGKERPFLAPISDLGKRECVDEEDKSGEMEPSCVLDLVFEQFKHCGKKHQEHISQNQDGEIESKIVYEAKEACVGMSNNGEIGDSRKRKNAFEGVLYKQFAQKGLVILGDDSRSRPKRRRRTINNEQKPLPLYNHYANGKGWWDSNMEGVDNDEVGFNEVWEGIGSATIGGLDWH